MAVPKKKTSPSRRGLRRGGNGTYKANMPNVVINKETGEYQLPHHISLILEILVHQFHPLNDDI